MKILVAGAYDDQLAEFRRLFPDVAFVRAENTAPADLQGDALIGMSRAPFDKVFTREFLAANRTVRWAHAPGAGIEFYCFDNLATSPIVMTNGKIIQGPEVAEHAVALTLCLTRRIGFVLKGVAGDKIPPPVELRGKVATVIGLGGIGLLVAERLSAFGMTVDAVTEISMPLLSTVRNQYYGDQLMEALNAADVVIMAAPLTPRTRNLLGRDQFLAMKKDANLVNVSRGGTVDLDALVVALEEGRFSGVGLDVTAPEPLPPDHRVRDFDRVIVTPHMAGRSDRLRERNFALLVNNIRRFLAGLPLLNIVDKTNGF